MARDVEDPLTLAFVEHEFGQRAGALSVRPPTLDIYDATPISVR